LRGYKEEGRRKKEEGRRKKEEGRRNSLLALYMGIGTPNSKDKLGIHTTASFLNLDESVHVKVSTLLFCLKIRQSKFNQEIRKRFNISRLERQLKMDELWNLEY
jgi:hypothetical protein